MGEPISLLDKREVQTAREWFRILREDGPDALKTAMDTHSERRTRIRKPATRETGT